jgi:hypothetical protein
LVELFLVEPGQGSEPDEIFEVSEAFDIRKYRDIDEFMPATKGLKRVSQCFSILTTHKLKLDKISWRFCTINNEKSRRKMLFRRQATHLLCIEVEQLSRTL